MGWLNHPLGLRGWLGRPGGGQTTSRPNKVAGHPSIFLFLLLLLFFWFLCFFFLNKICGGDILEKKKKKVKWSNCNNLKVWGLSVTFETFEVKVQMGG
jgi:hypothetical protein